MQTSMLFIGVDVAKSELVIAVGGQPSRAIANTTASIAQWLSGLAPHSCIAMESTGRYHALLAHLAFQAGMRVYVLNARDVYFYAKALGTRAKTDGVDAVVIARYVSEHHEHLHPWQPGSATQQQLKQLLTRRTKVVMHQSALRQILDAVQLQPLDTQGLHAAFAHLLALIDQQIGRLIASDQALQQGYQRLIGITGIGPQTAALLTELLSRIAFANADALVAYSGLDPRPNDSGTKRGRRRLSKKGPALLRRQMYLVAGAASHSKALKPLYLAIRAKGFAGTEALVILGRKLLRVAYSVWKSGAPFDPALLLPKTS